MAGLPRGNGTTACLHPLFFRLLGGRQRQEESNAVMQVAARRLAVADPTATCCLLSLGCSRPRLPRWFGVRRNLSWSTSVSSTTSWACLGQNFTTKTMDHAQVRDPRG